MGWIQGAVIKNQKSTEEIERERWGVRATAKVQHFEGTIHAETLNSSSSSPALSGSTLVVGREFLLPPVLGLLPAALKLG